MNVTYDRTAYLLEEAVRTEVALACRKPVTKAEIARGLKRRPGGLTVIEKLQREGVLKTAGHAPAKGKRRGGRRWLLADAWRDATERAAAVLRAGLLVADLELILVRATDVLPACQLLEAGDLPIAWGVPLRGEQMGLLLCPSHEPNEGRALRLLKKLGDRGIQPIRLHLPGVFTEPQLREWARDVGRGERDGLHAADKPSPSGFLSPR